MKRQRTKRDLTTGPIGPHLLRMSLPMGFGIMALISFQIVDMLFVAMLGTRELAAVSFTFPITMALFSLMMGIGIGVASIISRLTGRKRRMTARRITTHGVLFAALLGLIIGLGGYAAMTPLFRAMGAPEDLIPLIRDFMGIWFLGFVCISVPMPANSALRATGHAAFPGMVIVAAAIINAILDPILIFGLLGAPRLEVAGAALSTIIANAIEMIAVVWVLIRRDLLAPKFLIDLRLFGDSLIRALHVGAPAALTNAVTPLSHIVIVALLATHGAEAVAAFGIVSRIEAFALIPVMAVAVGLGPLTGQNWGAKHADRVREGIRTGLKYTTLCCAGAALLISPLAPILVGVFTDDPSVADIATLYLRIVPATYALMALVNLWSSSFNAMGLPGLAFGEIAFKMVGLYIPAAAIGSWLADIPGLVAGIALAHVTGGIGFHLWNSRYLNRRLANLETDAHAPGLSPSAR